jgi:hypothetical protein
MLLKSSTRIDLALYSIAVKARIKKMVIKKTIRPAGT